MKYCKSSVIGIDIKLELLMRFEIYLLSLLVYQTLSGYLMVINTE
jgi:hypothetical protein